MIAVNEGVSAYEEDFKPVFIEGAVERLTQMNGTLLSLEQDPRNQDLLDTLFRDAHTLKSGAMMVGFNDFAQVAHTLEDHLAEVRANPQLVTAPLVDLLLKTLNTLNDFLVANGAPAAPTGAATAMVDVAAAATPAALPLLGSQMDDTLPLIDEAVAAQIALGQHLDDPESLPAYRRLTLRLRQLQDNALATRMVAAGSLFPILRRTLRETARTTQKEVRWQASGEEVLLDRAILEALRDPLQQIVRNAVAHGIECDRTAAGKPVVATLAVDATNEGSEVIITIRDDGAGINLARVRTEAERQGIATAHLSSKDLIDLLFRPGFSTAPVITQSAGRGIGLDIVAAAIAKVRGHISVQTSPAGTEFKITVPNTLAVIPCALVAAAGQQFGLPLASVLAPDAAQDTNPIVLGSLLGLPEAACGPTITIADSGKRLTLQVDALDGQRDIIVRPLRGPLPPLDILTGAGLNPDGSIIIILRPAALLALAFGCGLSPVQP